MIGDSKRKGLARQYPIDLIVERQLEEVTAYLSQQMETGRLYLWQMVDTNPDMDEFSVTLIQGGQRTSQAWLKLRRWEGTHTRIIGSMNFNQLRIRQPLWWAIYIQAVILVVIGFWAAVVAAVTPLLVLILSGLLVASPFALYVPFAILSEYLETRRLAVALRDYLRNGMR
jgi:hypothetical protein